MLERSEMCILHAYYNGAMPPYPIICQFQSFPNASYFLTWCPFQATITWKRRHALHRYKQYYKKLLYSDHHHIFNYLLKILGIKPPISKTCHRKFVTVSKSTYHNLIFIFFAKLVTNRSSKQRVTVHCCSL